MFEDIDVPRFRAFERVLLEEFMKPHGISMNALGTAIGVPPGRISQIVNGKRAITADTALRLGRYFGVSPETWLDLQSDYDLRIARRERGREIERTVAKLDVA